jgi:hypothetical protein
MFFFFDERQMTELHVSDWIEYQVRVGRPMYVFSQADPHEVFIERAARRSSESRSTVVDPIRWTENGAT